MCWVRARADRLDRAETFAEPEGRAPGGLAAEALAPEALAPGELAAARPPDGPAPDATEDAALVRGAGWGLEAAAVGVWPGVEGAVAGPNVATDSMAPATRHTARMLASSGMTVPCPPNGAVILRSRVRRRWARISRW